MYKIIISLLVFMCIGCCQEQGSEKINTVSTHKYSIGDIVYFKLNNQKGIVVETHDKHPDFLLRPRGEHLYYTIKTGVDQSMGISTAAGSGAFGHTQHYPPDAFSISIVHEKELK